MFPFSFILKAIAEKERTVDPNDINPSPSLSAIRHLDIRTPSPSPSAKTAESHSTPQALHAQNQRTKSGPQGHGVNASPASSLSTLRLSPHRQPPTADRTTPQATPMLRAYAQKATSQTSSSAASEATPRQSKLASLARARRPPSIVSVSSEDSTDSTATFPVLRPLSFLDPHSLGADKALPPPEEAVRKNPFPSTMRAREDSFARAMEDTLYSIPSRGPSTPSSLARPIPPPEPLVVEPRRGSPRAATPRTSSPKALSASERVLERPEHEPLVTEKAPSVVTEKPSSIFTDKPPVSKLAQLAAAKAASREKDKDSESRKIMKPRILSEPFAKTEYIKRTSRGPAQTTAITTYTQTVDNMIPYSRADLPSSYPLPGKQSKLAAKAKKGASKDDPAKREDNTRQEALERARSHAQNLITNRDPNAVAEPSPFALLLVDDYGRTKVPDKASSDSRQLRNERKEAERLRKRQHKEAMLPMHLLNPAILRSSAFAFDVPSPDDVVMSARKGTALAAARYASSPSHQASRDQVRARTKTSAR